LVNRLPDNSVVSHFDYIYDDRGLRTTMTTNEGTWTYKYDDDGQLTDWTDPQHKQYSIRYDAVGNRISETTDGDMVQFYTTNNLNQYTQVGNTKYFYDADGNLTRTENGADVTTYSYDAENRLVGVTHGADVTVYKYDALGDRTASVVNGSPTKFVTDPIGFGNVVGEYSAAGQLLARNDYGFGLISRATGSAQTVFYTFDAMGNTSDLLSPTASLISHYSFDPFGISRNAPNSLTNPFGVGGEFGLMTGSSNVVAVRARFLDPSLGRFTSEDPLGLRAPNLYAYSDNVPTMLTDPSGLGSEPPPDFGEGKEFVDGLGGMLGGIMNNDNTYNYFGS
jgi:RHS repeat-associated protein